MVDTIAAPASDTCVLEGCGRPRSDHGQRGHMFVTASQMATRRAVDPFRDIRRMTEEERAGANGHAPGSAAKVAPAKKATIAATVSDPDYCTVPGCGKPKSSHRGSIGHRFNGDPLPWRDVTPKPPCAVCGKPPLSHRGKNAKAHGHTYQRETVDVFSSQPEPAGTYEHEPVPDLNSGRTTSPPNDAGRPRTVRRSTACVHYAFERALRSIDIGRVEMRIFEIETQRSIEGELLTAVVTVKASVIFAAAEEV